MRNWPYAYDLLAAADSPVKERFGVVRLPGVSALGGANLAISRFSRRRRTALEFIQDAVFSVLGLGEEPARAAQRLSGTLAAALAGR
jgi:hypothetical protein